MELNPRQQDVLRATVRHYVSTAEPVGSKALADGYDLQVSSATIRNVMSVLEASGLLYQPHTSAGRIPSDSGYRTYVDRLMAPSESLARRVESTLNQRLDWNAQAMASLMQESAQILASLSGYVALVTMPQMDDSVVKHLQLVRVSDHQILLVVVDSYDNRSVLLPLPRRSVSQSRSQAESSPEAKTCAPLENFHNTAQASDETIDRELRILSNFLTEQMQGRSLQDVQLDWSMLDQAFARYATGLQQAMVDLSRRSRAHPATQILISGLAEVLDQPEFAERSQIRSIVQLLEDGRDQLWPLISADRISSDSMTDPAAVGHGLTRLSARPVGADEEASDTSRLRIWIGTENPVEPMRSCALVTAVYGVSPGPVGSLGVLGPTRMLYENAIAAVEAAADYLTAAVSNSYAVE